MSDDQVVNEISNEVKKEEQVISPAIQPQEKKEESVFDEAKRVLKETKEAVKQITEERKRIEKAAADLLVNGRSFAGQQPAKQKEETPKEYKERILRGGI